MAKDMHADTPKTVLDLAESCVRFVEKALDLKLDYTQDTLPVLDHYLERARRDGKDEVFGLIGPAAGAYFGEVARRHLEDGRWFAPEENYAEWRLEFGQCFLHFNPIGIALESLHEKELDWDAHFQVLDADRSTVVSATKSLGEDVRADDFYRLTVRLEVLEQIYVTLQRARSSAAPGQPPFDRAIYDAVIHGRVPKTPLN